MPLVPLLLSFLAPGPARAGRFKCPEAGGPAWREVRTAHVVVRTDLPSGKARDLAEELERVYEAVRHGLFRNPPDTGVIQVVARYMTSGCRFPGRTAARRWMRGGGRPRWRRRSGTIRARFRHWP